MSRVQLATGVSLLSLVAFVWRALLDWKMVPMFEYLDSAGETARFSMLYVVVVGVWAASLVGTSHGSKLAAAAGVACNLLSGVTLGIMALLWYCPYPCPSMPPLMDAAIQANLWLGFGGAAALLAVLVDKREAVQPSTT